MFDSMIGVLGDMEGDKQGGVIDGWREGVEAEGIHIEYADSGEGKDVNLEDKEEEDDESDDWVAQAFLDQDNKDDIGINDFYGDYEKDREIRKNLDILEAAYASKDEVSSLRKARKNVKINKSDKDGGAGVFGRLRAAGTNSVSSRILGAYPGDAVSIEETASAGGVVDLATKYGYGDWSDDFDDSEIGGEDYHGSRGRRKQRYSRRGLSNKKRRKKRRIPPSSSQPSSKGDSSSNGFSVSLDSNGFSFGFGAPSEITFSTGTPTRKTRRRKVIRSRTDSSQRLTHEKSTGQEITVTKRRITRKIHDNANVSLIIFYIDLLIR